VRRRRGLPVQQINVRLTVADAARLDEYAAELGRQRGVAARSIVTSFLLKRARAQRGRGLRAA
jgi:hypothetical protein